MTWGMHAGSDELGLSDSTLAEQLAKHGESVLFKAGKIIFKEGDPSDVIYVLISGQLRVFSEDNLGREVVYNIVQPGELVGEMLLDGGVRSASVRAVSDARCAVIEQARFEDIVASNPEFSRLVIEHLIARLRKATLKIRSFAFDGVYERVTGALSELAVESKDGYSLPPGLTQQEIANRVGASREMVNYVIRALIKGGFLARKGRTSLHILKKLPARW